jgi:drug/metabolite transporter (DMT)-like permease
VTAVVLALLAAASWGTGDFLGGLSSRRTHVVTVLALSQLAGLLAVLVWLGVSDDPVPGPVAILAAVGAGLAGAVGLAALYRGLAVGAMGIVAPISAAAPIVPLSVDVARGESPSPLQWLGIGLVVAGIAVLSREPAAGTRRGLAAGAGLALVAAASFGLFFVGIDAAADASVPWAVVVARATSTVLAFAAALALSVRPVAPAALLPAIVGVGVFDTAANVSIAAATTHGSTGIVAVLSSLYPAVTIVLARVALGERIPAPRRVGGVVALAGAALVAGG